MSPGGRDDRRLSRCGFRYTVSARWPVPSREKRRSTRSFCAQALFQNEDFGAPQREILARIGRRRKIQARNIFVAVNSQSKLTPGNDIHARLRFEGLIEIPWLFAIVLVNDKSLEAPIKRRQVG